MGGRSASGSPADRWFSVGRLWVRLAEAVPFFSPSPPRLLCLELLSSGHRWDCQVLCSSATSSCLSLFLSRRRVSNFPFSVGLFGEMRGRDCSLSRKVFSGELPRKLGFEAPSGEDCVIQIDRFTVVLRLFVTTMPLATRLKLSEIQRVARWDLRAEQLELIEAGADEILKYRRSGHPENAGNKQDRTSPKTLTEAEDLSAYDEHQVSDPRSLSSFDLQRRLQKFYHFVGSGNIFPENSRNHR